MADAIAAGVSCVSGSFLGAALSGLLLPFSPCAAASGALSCSGASFSENGATLHVPFWLQDQTRPF